MRVACTFLALITQAIGRYCVDSLSPLFAHVWVAVLEATAVTFAMYFLIQFYYQIKDDIADQRPFLKLLAIKLVIFFSFWQTVRGNPPCSPPTSSPLSSLKCKLCVLSC